MINAVDWSIQQWFLPSTVQVQILVICTRPYRYLLAVALEYFKLQVP